MELQPASKKPFLEQIQNEKGIALFMVIAALALITLLATELTFTAHMNQKIAFDSFDQVKAHYLAKSAFKLSLLRLKAYQQVTEFAKGSNKSGGGSANITLPRKITESIWSFPFVYPIPTELPGMSSSDKDRIKKFQEESSLEGNFTALIESESSKYNLNLLLASFVPKEIKKEDKSKKPDNTQTNTDNSQNTPTNPNQKPEEHPFDPKEARESLQHYLAQILEQKFDKDTDFASEYRDFRLDELINNIAAWADRTFQSPNWGNDSVIPAKGAPYYSVSELHMVPMMDDKLFDLFSPYLTASPTPGINVNTMREATLRAIIPEVSDDEVKAFFEFRDSQEQDNQFKNPDEFFKYAQENFGRFANKSENMDDFKQELEKRRIRLVTDETEFKITVRAQVNQSTKTIESYVTLVAPNSTTPTTNNNNSNTNPSQPNTPPLVGPGGAGTLASKKENFGLKVTFFRII